MNIGIDLGTYNSAGAVVVGKQIVMVQSSATQTDEYAKNFPSFVLFDKKGEKQQVGINAKMFQAESPKNVIWGVKRLVGISYEEAERNGELKRFKYDISRGKDESIVIHVGSRDYTPVQILQFILEEIKKNAEDEDINGNLPGRIENAVVSVQAYFDPIRTKLIADAVKAAGLDNVEMIAEPTAATLTYVNSPIYGPKLAKKKENRIMTFDIGAGTLDVTAMLVIRNDSGDLITSERCTTGDPALGGIDIDEIFTDHLIDKYNLGSIRNDQRAFLKFNSDVEKAKIALSNDVTIILPLPNKKTVNITRNELEQELGRRISEKVSFLERCRSPINLALKLINWKASDLDHVLFVGGPSYMPCIRSLVINELKAKGARQDVLDELAEWETELPVNPMECVAQGAALKAGGAKLGPRPVSAGYGTTIGKYYYQVIPPNSFCPISLPEEDKPLVLSTAAGQRVSFALIEKIPYDKNNNIVYKYKHLGDLDYYPKLEGVGTHIDIAMELSKSKNLKIKLTQIVLDPDTGATNKLDTHPFEGLNKFSGQEISLEEYTEEVEKEQQKNIQEIIKHIISTPGSKWTYDQLERAIHVAENIVDDAGNCYDPTVKQLVERLKRLISHNPAPENGPDIMNAMLVLLNALYNSGEIDQAVYQQRQKELRLIVKS